MQKADLGIRRQTLQVWPLYSCNSSPEDLSKERNVKLANTNTKLINLHQILQIYLSKRRKVESKQPASIQLPSFDIDIQLTGCPKSSDISLVHNEGKKKLVECP